MLVPDGHDPQDRRRPGRQPGDGDQSVLVDRHPSWVRVAVGCQVKSGL